MILSTTDSLDGHVINKYIGLVVGEGVIGARAVSTMSSSVAGADGRGSGAYELDLKKAKDAAVESMKARATEVGANGIVGIDIDYVSAGKDGSMVMVVATGTAVVIQ